MDIREAVRAETTAALAEHQQSVRVQMLELARSAAQTPAPEAQPDAQTFKVNYRRLLNPLRQAGCLIGSERQNLDSRCMSTRQQP